MRIYSHTILIFHLAYTIFEKELCDVFTCECERAPKKKSSMKETWQHKHASKSKGSLCRGCVRVYDSQCQTHTSA